MLDRVFNSPVAMWILIIQGTILPNEVYSTHTLFRCVQGVIGIGHEDFLTSRLSILPVNIAQSSCPPCLYLEQSLVLARQTITS